MLDERNLLLDDLKNEYEENIIQLTNELESNLEKLVENEDVIKEKLSIIKELQPQAAK